MRILTLLLSVLIASPIWAVDSIYCPQNHGYISVGMTQAEVLQKCGTPTVKKKSNAPLMRKVPMIELVYNNEGGPKAFYGVWSLPVGVSVGASLEVGIVDNKVYSVLVTGEGTSAFSLCRGQDIVKGDPVSKVYNLCGNPSAINDSYITQTVSETALPEIWAYTAPYQPTIRLTFLNGKLESINDQ